jgi:hypothetical protein
VPQITNGHTQDIPGYMQAMQIGDNEEPALLDAATPACGKGLLAEGLPNTPLLRLAAERGWRVAYYADDGSGAVEIVPGAFLEIVNQNSGDHASRDWSFSVGFCASRPPLDEEELAIALPDILMKTAQCILDTTDKGFAAAQR